MTPPHSLAWICALLVAATSFAQTPTHTDRSRALLPELAKYVALREAEFDQIPAERKVELDALARQLAQRAADDKPLRLCFICTHNSRRSHMAQLWVAAAAARYGVAGVQTYSGGTEATAFNPRAVAALRKAGFNVKQTTRDENPIYHVRYAAELPPITSFSKVYDQAPNPRGAFVAVMTCAGANEACPTVRGADLRVAITYEDPKAFDGTQQEEAKYAERCAQIAREMLHLVRETARQSTDANHPESETAQ